MKIEDWSLADAPAHESRPSKLLVPLYVTGDERDVDVLGEMLELNEGAVFEAPIQRVALNEDRELSVMARRSRRAGPTQHVWLSDSLAASVRRDFYAVYGHRRKVPNWEALLPEVLPKVGAMRASSAARIDELQTSLTDLESSRKEAVADAMRAQAQSRLAAIALWATTLVAIIAAALSMVSGSALPIAVAIPVNCILIGLAAIAHSEIQPSKWRYVGSVMAFLGLAMGCFLVAIAVTS